MYESLDLGEGTIDLKRITRYKLALLFASANLRKFLGLLGSEAARPSTSNEAT